MTCMSKNRNCLQELVVQKSIKGNTYSRVVFKNQEDAELLERLAYIEVEDSRYMEDRTEFKKVFWIKAEKLEQRKKDRQTNQQANTTTNADVDTLKSTFDNLQNQINQLQREKEETSKKFSSLQAQLTRMGAEVNKTSAKMVTIETTLNSWDKTFEDKLSKNNEIIVESLLRRLATHTQPEYIDNNKQQTHTYPQTEQTNTTEHTHKRKRTTVGLHMESDKMSPSKRNKDANY